MLKKVLFCAIALSFMYSTDSMARICLFGKNFPDCIKRGSYMKSCTDIEYRESSAKLSATCQKKNGKWVKTSLTVRLNQKCSGIENLNGKLSIIK